MQRIPEPELMNDPVQAEAYAGADFEEPHNRFIEFFHELVNTNEISGQVLDLGCGPADISVRFAKAFPDCVIHAVDGAACMLEQGKLRVTRENLHDRIQLFHGQLPGFQLPARQYRFIISNSLLHHLHKPEVLWQYIRQYSAPGSFVFIMDLRRPESKEQARELVNIYSANEPDILKRDFYNSLCAAFTQQEVKKQLQECNLGNLDLQVISDRHMLIYGNI